MIEMPVAKQSLALLLSFYSESIGKKKIQYADEVTERTLALLQEDDKKHVPSPQRVLDKFLKDLKSDQGALRLKLVDATSRIALQIMAVSQDPAPAEMLVKEFHKTLNIRPLSDETRAALTDGSYDLLMGLNEAGRPDANETLRLAKRLLSNACVQNKTDPEASRETMRKFENLEAFSDRNALFEVMLNKFATHDSAGRYVYLEPLVTRATKACSLDESKWPEKTMDQLIANLDVADADLQERVLDGIYSVAMGRVEEKDDPALLHKAFNAVLNAAHDAQDEEAAAFLYEKAYGFFTVLKDEEALLPQQRTDFARLLLDNVDAGKQDQSYQTKLMYDFIQTKDMLEIDREALMPKVCETYNRYTKSVTEMTCPVDDEWAAQQEYRLVMMRLLMQLRPPAE